MNINICISRIAASAKQQDHVHKPKDKPQENPQRAPHQSNHKCKNNHTNHVNDRSKVFAPHSDQSSKFIPICYHCGVKGHIRPWCYQYNSMCKLVLNSKSLGKLKHVDIIDKRSNSFIPQKNKFQKPLRKV
ncbi:hypothetical protein ACOSP7_019376 [Xanthoceras sorbifolium]